MKKISIIVLVVAVVVLAGVVVWQNWIKPAPTVNNQPVVNQPAANCLKEGETSPVYQGDFTIPDCCSGLSQITAPYSWDNDSTCPSEKLTIPSDIVCTYCGNGVCGTGENQCNCPADCKINKVSINVKSFDLANNSFKAKDIDSNNDITIRYTSSTKFYRMADGKILNYYSANDFYSLLNNWVPYSNWNSALGGFRVLGITEEKNTIEANEVFFIAQ